MQSVSLRIWTCVAVAISYDDNHYTTATSLRVLNRMEVVWRLTWKHGVVPELSVRNAHTVEAGTQREREREREFDFDLIIYHFCHAINTIKGTIWKASDVILTIRYLIVYINILSHFTEYLSEIKYKPKTHTHIHIYIYIYIYIYIRVSGCV